VHVANSKRRFFTSVNVGLTSKAIRIIDTDIAFVSQEENC
jgi:hypothetical protein